MKVENQSPKKEQEQMLIIKTNDFSKTQLDLVKSTLCKHLKNNQKKCLEASCFNYHDNLEAEKLQKEQRMKKFQTIENLKSEVL